MSFTQLDARRERYFAHLDGMILPDNIIRYFGNECFYDSPISSIIFGSSGKSVDEIWTIFMEMGFEANKRRKQLGTSRWSGGISKSVCRRL